MHKPIERGVLLCGGVQVHIIQKHRSPRLLKLGRIMFGSAVAGDGKIYVGEYGRFYILQPDLKAASREPWFTP